MFFRRTLVHQLFGCLFAIATIVLWSAFDVPAQEIPHLTDERLEISLFVETPEIVTPIGMVIDQQNRIFVIESHTHHPPSDYDGPKTDRILLFVDHDDDGKPEESSVYATGIQQAMNLALSPEGQLFVVCAREVVRLDDENQDGVCDKQERVLRLVTRERYAHNSLLGITFDRAGWMYVSRGNTGSHPYRFEGADESTVEGFGDGGNIVRCRADGTRLEEFATGFWNPFDLKFDRSGRLLMVDNDPDARGPNRLIHVINGGDYGYKSLYGGSGNHAFQGWDGSLAGTLPYIAGTGEAPSGLIDCRRSSLPIDYRKCVLATIWNENSIECFELREAKGTLVLVEKSRFMQGSKDFRPVAIDCDRRGNLFVSDWVLVNYPNHGRGRIWRISTKDKTKRLAPQSYFSPYAADSTRVERSTYFNASEEQTLIKGLTDSDPFIRNAAQQRLMDSDFSELVLRLADHREPLVRLGVLLATKSSKSSQVSSDLLIRRFLSDADPDVRQAALMWAGQSMKRELRPYLDVALKVPPVTALIFETYLAAVQNLDEEFIAAYKAKATRANKIPRKLDADVVLNVAQSEGYSSDVRRMAIRNFDDKTASVYRSWLLEIMSESDDVLSMAAMRRLVAVEKDDMNDLSQRLTTVALNSDRTTSLRCEALLWLGEIRMRDPQRILPLLESANAQIAIEAARTFRTLLDSGHAVDHVKTLRQMSLSNEVQTRLSEALYFVSGGHQDRPQTKEEWQVALESGGDPSRGRRVFYTGRVGCSKCHTIDGRGAVLGPDLSRVAQSKTRAQIADSILDPSAEFPPQYQAWAVITADGRTHRGLQLDHKSGGAIVLTTESGENVRFTAKEIEDYAALPTSIMPSGLSQTMSVDEFRDLLSFLHSMK